MSSSTLQNAAFSSCLFFLSASVAVPMQQPICKDLPFGCLSQTSAPSTQPKTERERCCLQIHTHLVPLLPNATSLFFCPSPVFSLSAVRALWVQGLHCSIIHHSQGLEGWAPRKGGVAEEHFCSLAKDGETETVISGTQLVCQPASRLSRYLIYLVALFSGKKKTVAASIPVKVTERKPRRHREWWRRQQGTQMEALRMRDRSKCEEKGGGHREVKKRLESKMENKKHRVFPREKWFFSFFSQIAPLSREYMLASGNLPSYGQIPNTFPTGYDPHGISFLISPGFLCNNASSPTPAPHVCSAF